MARPVEIVSIELKCDAPGCDHIETIEAISPGLVGKPCPKCGASLLTEDDLKSGLMIEALASLVNGMVGNVEPSGEVMHVGINPHNGDWNIKVRAHD